MSVELVRRICPDPVWRTLHDVKEKLALALMKPAACSTEALRHLTEADLGAFFSSEAITRDWNQDKETLTVLDLPELTGGVNQGDQRAIYYLIHALNPGAVLEIGTHIGCSTVNIGLALKRVAATQGSPPRLTTVDLLDVNDPTTKPWLRFQSAHSPQELVERAGVAPLVSFVTSDSLAFLENCQQKFDLIFLDGDHRERRVCQEIPLALRRLTEGGIILLHDYFPDEKPLWSNNRVVPGPYRATQRLLRQGARFVVHPLGNLPWPTKFDSSATSLAVVSASPAG
jgi:predicted O-methyltransferase YrrM